MGHLADGVAGDVAESATEFLEFVYKRLLTKLVWFLLMFASLAHGIRHHLAIAIDSDDGDGVHLRYE